MQMLSGNFLPNSPPALINKEINIRCCCVSAIQGQLSLAKFFSCKYLPLYSIMKSQYNVNVCSSNYTLNTHTE